VQRKESRKEDKYCKSKVGSLHIHIQEGVVSIKFGLREKERWKRHTSDNVGRHCL
jgi:hypothetical protein